VALVDDEDFERVNQFYWQAGYEKTTHKYYAKGHVNGKPVLMHRYILSMTDPKVLVDHRFHDTLDNRKENLRVCTNSQNSANSKKQQSDRSSKFKGVSWHKVRKKWCSVIGHGKASFHLGLFETQEAAALAYNLKAKALFGEFALLNELTEEEMTIALSHPPKIESSKFKGVSWHRKARKWMAQISIKGQHHHLGLFSDEMQAAKVYSEAKAATKRAEIK